MSAAEGMPEAAESSPERAVAGTAETAGATEVGCAADVSEEPPPLAVGAAYCKRAPFGSSRWDAKYEFSSVWSIRIDAG